MKSFKKIVSREQLAFILGIPDRQLTYILYGIGVEKCYRSFKIPKKSGEYRTINAPNEQLKDVQRKLADVLAIYQQQIWKEKSIEPKIAHAFLKNKNILTNARIHRNKKYILNLDLKDFFDSFHFGRVEGYFEKNSNFLLDKKVAIIIAQLTCYQGVLPQGAPTSPIITNLIFQVVDNRILGLARRYRLDYTRYADDLTFSTNDKGFKNHKDEFIKKLSNLLIKSGFVVNAEKTRFSYYYSRQSVTGITVNNKLNASKEYIKTTRAMANSLYTTGSFIQAGEAGTINQLEGRFAFIDQIDLYNNKIDEDHHKLFKLNTREKEYQKFLFFKYFIGNKRPLIVTEGKTDIVHIRTALEKMESKYSNLIKKDKDGYKYNISFLHKTKKLRFFLGINQDGADAMKNIYNLYSGLHGYPNLFEYFCKKNEAKKKPIILLFDNELAVKGKPLNSFVSFAKLSDEQKNELSTKSYIRLIADSNLYLATMPLITGMKECEIEDLYEKNVLETIIEGKHFERKAGPEDKAHYGKEVFAQYISKSDSVDFSGFTGLFDVIESILKENK